MKLMYADNTTAFLPTSLVSPGELVENLYVCTRCQPIAETI